MAFLYRGLCQNGWNWMKVRPNLNFSDGKGWPVLNLSGFRYGK